MIAGAVFLSPLAAVAWPAQLTLALVGGILAGAFVNWAAYWLAWNRRPISPWSPAHPNAPARRASDRLPIVGWIGLRREASLHGRAFWTRAVAVELLMGGAWAALYWWEVSRQGLVAGQFEALAGGPVPPGALVAPLWTTLATFASHATLLTLMAAASLIDIDEKTIPDAITVPGTLLGLALAAVLPLSLLPHVAIRAVPPAAGAPVAVPAGGLAANEQLYVEPLTVASPHAWPAALDGAPEWLGLAIGLACYATWCLALTPRIWRGRRGVAFALRVLGARVARELGRRPLAWIGLGGSLAIVGVWLWGGAAWTGLLTALVGMIGASAMFWAVRLVGSAALGREAMGFGDVTLMMMIGTYLGWQSGIIIFFVAPFFGLVAGLLQVVLRRDDVIPYGPYLCMGALVLMVRWADVWNVGPRGLQEVFALGLWIPVVLAVGVVMLWAMLVLWRNIKEALFRYEDAED